LQSEVPSRLFALRNLLGPPSLNRLVRLFPNIYNSIILNVMRQLGLDLSGWGQEPVAGCYRDTTFLQFIQNEVNFFPSCGTVSVCRKIPFLLISHLSHLAAGFMHAWFIVFALRAPSSDITIHHVYADYPQTLW